MTEPEKQLNFNILPTSTGNALKYLSQQQWLDNSDWYLAGGTALALQAGHRKSFDLDFFSPSKNFNNNQLLANFAETKSWKTQVDEPNTIYGTLFDAKVSFIAYPFLTPSHEFLAYGSVRILDARDIAVMKIIAISQRGRKRDFYDMFWCANYLEPLEKTIRQLPIQYPNLAHNYNHILTSLIYFDDAENDPEPEIFFDANWKNVKDYFVKKVPDITRSTILLES